MEASWLALKVCENRSTRSGSLPRSETSPGIARLAAGVAKCAIMLAAITPISARSEPASTGTGRSTSCMTVAKTISALEFQRR